MTLSEHGERLLTREALVSLARSLRSLSIRYAREASDWEQRGHYANFAHCQTEARDYRRKARWYINFARNIG